MYDAVLLLDRAMSVPLQAAEGELGVAMAACLLLATRHSGLPLPPDQVSARERLPLQGRGTSAAASSAAASRPLMPSRL